MNADAKRFWSKVEKTGDCWMWMAGRDLKGYGRFSVGGSRNEDGSRRNSMVSAHRYAYELENGPIPNHESFHGLCVLHRCDNPSFVRPEHLFIGTNEDNVRDMDRKGRRVNSPSRGSLHGNAVLDEQQVFEIVRRHREEGVSQTRLAREHGVSIGTVNHIFTGRNWAHLGLSNRRNGA